MTRARSRNIVWLALLVTAPVPFFLVVTGWVPVARLLQLLGVTFAFIGVEGPAGALRLVAMMLALQIVLWTGLLRLAAGLVASGLQRLLGPSRLAAATWVTVVLLVGTAVMVPLYRTPFRVDSLHATLLEVFE